MITAFLAGGLGNQMFQIAAAYSLALDNNDEAVFDFTRCWTPNQGNHAINYIKNIYKHLRHQEGIINIVEQEYHEPEGSSFEHIPYTNNLIIRGCFQDVRFFNNHYDKIKKIFNIEEKYKDFLLTRYKQLEDFTKLTSVHVRRGDFLKFPDAHPLCTKEYYTLAMKELPNQDFIFISDDMNWVRDNFKGENIFYSDVNNDILDLTLMTMCSNNIIANSTFSWWGAFLNPNKTKKIISPAGWIKGPNTRYI